MLATAIGAFLINVIMGKFLHGDHGGHGHDHGHSHNHGHEHKHEEHSHEHLSQ